MEEEREADEETSRTIKQYKEAVKDLNNERARAEETYREKLNLKVNNMDNTNSREWRSLTKDVMGKGGKNTSIGSVQAEGRMTTSDAETAEEFVKYLAEKSAISDVDMNVPSVTSNVDCSLAEIEID